MKKRGFILVMSLMLCLLLFVVGIAYLGLKASQYRSASEAQLALQAKALAESGLEDFRVKLDRDSEFPPQTADNGLYSYREQLTIGGVVRGSYNVSVDSNYAVTPFLILVVTCTGEVGASAQTGISRRSLRAEIDIAPFLRSDGTTPNPNFRHIINVQDLGGS